MEIKMTQAEQGVFADRYKVIPRCLIFLFNEENVLLIKGHASKRLWPNLYNGIGGHIEYGEDILTAARRELEEESGLTCDDLWLCGQVMVDASVEVGISIFIFKGTYQEGEIKTSSEGELEWVNLEEIKRLPLVIDLHTILPLVEAFNKGDAVFSARYYYDENGELQIVINK